MRRRRRMPCLRSERVPAAPPSSTGCRNGSFASPGRCAPVYAIRPGTHHPEQPPTRTPNRIATAPALKPRAGESRPSAPNPPALRRPRLRAPPPGDSRRRAVSRSGAVDPLPRTPPARPEGAECERRTPVCGQNPKEPRRRAAGAPGIPNRRIGAPPPRALRRKAGSANSCLEIHSPGFTPAAVAEARGGSGARISRNGSPPPRPAGADLRSRPPGGRSMIRARPRPLHRFGSQPIEPPAVK